MTVTTTPPEIAPEATDRLATESAKLRSRRSLPIDRGFQAAGAALLGIGLLAIVAGWYGVSHTARDFPHTRRAPYRHTLRGPCRGLSAR